MSESGSVNNLANAMRNLNSTYDAAATPGTSDSMGDIADYSGLGAPFPDSDYSNDGYDLKLWGNFATWSTGSNFSGSRIMQNIGTGGQNFPCNQYVVVDSGDYIVRALVDDVKIYRNGTLANTITNAGDGISVGVSPGDLLGLTRPANIQTGNNYDMAAVYMGWSGFVFCHRRDRQTGATLTIATLADETNWEVRYSTVGLDVTSTTFLDSGSLEFAYSTASVTMTSTRNHIIYADKPIACYVRLVSGLGTNDTLPLYPMDQDDKFGAVSNSGHAFIINNASQGRDGVSVTQQLFVSESDGVNTTEVNATSAYNAWYIDTNIGPKSGGGFLGPVQKMVSGNGGLHAAEQQADGDGSEMTPFVSKKAFGKAACLMFTVDADWVTCISDSAIDIEHRDNSGVLVTSQTMTGTNGIFFTRFTSVATGSIFTSDDDFIMYADTNATLKDEKVFIMGDTKFQPATESISFYTPDGTTRTSYGNSGSACSDGPVGDPVTVYCLPDFSVGSQVFTDTALSTPLSNDSTGWYYVVSGSGFAVEYSVSNPNIINVIAPC